MIPSPIPIDPPGHLDALLRHEVLDAPPEERLDRLSRLAARLLDVPVAHVALADGPRERPAGARGPRAAGAARRASSWPHAIEGDAATQVEDTTRDARFADDPLVTGEPRLRFWACRPLSVDARRAGALCVVDLRPRRLDAAGLATLDALGRVAERELAGAPPSARAADPRPSNRQGFLALASRALAGDTGARRGAIAVALRLATHDRIRADFGADEAAQALRGWASLVGSVFGGSDTVARTGPDGCAVLMADASRAGAEACVRRLRVLVAGYNDRLAPAFRLRFAAGVADWSPERHGSAERLLLDAECRMTPVGLDRFETRAA